MRHVIETMGTMASIDVTGAALVDLTELESIFRAVDTRFSLYRPDSELSLIASGRLMLTDASETMLASYARALDWRAATHGLFTPHRPDGIIDLNGLVKAEAIEQAGAFLDGSGCPRWTINVGGDILARTGILPALTGIADPTDDSAILCSIALRGTRRAIATSGSAQRGDHIWRGGDVLPPHFAQVSVIADDIVTADILATAIVAGGPDALDDVTDRWPVDVLTVGRDGGLSATPGFRAALSQ